MTNYDRAFDKLKAALGKSDSNSPRLASSGDALLERACDDATVTAPEVASDSKDSEIYVDFGQHDFDEIDQEVGADDDALLERLHCRIRKLLNADVAPDAAQQRERFGRPGGASGGPRTPYSKWRDRLPKTGSQSKSRRNQTQVLKHELAAYPEPLEDRGLLSSFNPAVDVLGEAVAAAFVVASTATALYKASSCRKQRKSEADTCLIDSYFSSTNRIDETRPNSSLPFWHRSQRRRSWSRRDAMARHRACQTHVLTTEGLEPRLLLHGQPIGELPDTIAVRADFEQVQTPYALGTHDAAPSPQIMQDDDGSFLRLVHNQVPNNNSVTFDRTVTGAYELVVASFEMRMTPQVGRADGVGFALLNTAIFGSHGAVPPQVPFFAAEEPRFARSFGLGFDVYRNPDLADVDNNHVSVHYDGKTIHQEPVSLGPDGVDLASGEWIRVDVVLATDDGHTSISVTLTPHGGDAITVLNHFHIEGFEPYDFRAHFSARSGGQTVLADIRDVDIRVGEVTPATVEFQHERFTVVEQDGAAAQVFVVSTGGHSDPLIVDYETVNGSAVAGTDFTATTGTLEFSPGQFYQIINIPIADNDIVEPNRELQIRLTPRSENVSLGEQSTVVIEIVDDDDPAIVGTWDDLQQTEVVAIHAIMLPTGQVLYWDRIGNARVWDPVTNVTLTPEDPGFDEFCAGHTILPDGRVMIAGGHLVDEDGVGVPDAAIFDATTLTWETASRMRDNRWYPTLTLLANGEVVAISGSQDAQYTVNTIPEVYSPETDSWRDLSGAERHLPLYPFGFVSTKGVFYAGPHADTALLDTSENGSWTEVDTTEFGEQRDYSTAAMIRLDRVLIVGGNAPRHGFEFPTRTVEIIDLSIENPEWQYTDPMAFGRRHATGTILSNGQFLVTGGHSSPGFNDASVPVYAAESWDPDTGKWTTWAAMDDERLYHSVALLLPDASVLVAGGGQPVATGGDADHLTMQRFEPPYLHQGPRPEITDAPELVGYGDRFFVELQDVSNVDQVTWVTPGSVTHAFDQSQRFSDLAFEVVEGGLMVTAPSGPTHMPPGFQMMFVHANGVPSVAHMMQVLDGDRIPGVVVDAGSGITASEGDAGAELSIRLTSAPSADVTITLSPGPQVDVDETSITFTPDTWNASQTIVLTAVDDNVAEGEHLGRVAMAVSSEDAAYHEVSVAPLIATLGDNDSAGVTVVETNGTTTVREGGSGDQVSIVLISEPTSDVRVSLVPNNQLSVSLSTVTFTSANWNVPQVIDVSAVDDGVSEGDHSGVVTLSANSADSNYELIDVRNVIAAIADNELPLGDNQWNVRAVGLDAFHSNEFDIRPWRSGQPQAPWVDWAANGTEQNGGWFGRGENLVWRNPGSVGAFSVSQNSSTGRLEIHGDRDHQWWAWTYVYVEEPTTVSLNMDCDCRPNFYIDGNFDSRRGRSLSVELAAGWHRIDITGYNQNNGYRGIVTGLAGQVDIMDSVPTYVPNPNAAPTITTIASVTTDEDTPTEPVSFTVADDQTAAGDLLVSVDTSNESLIPLAGIALIGEDGNRSLTLTPSANVSGTATITVSVSDGELTAQETFSLTVNAVNDPPTLDPVADQGPIDEDAGPFVVPLTGLSAGPNEREPVTLRVDWSGQVISQIVHASFDPETETGELLVSLTPDASGVTPVTVTVTDGDNFSITRSFSIDVDAINDAPRITQIEDQAILANASTGPLTFTVSDVDDVPTELVVTAVSSNPGLVSDENIRIDGDAGTRTLVVTPKPDQSGTSRITLTVSDGALTTTSTFELSVALPATIQGLKWHDQNSNRVRDAGEPLLPDVTVFLDANENRILDTGEQSVATDANGRFAFEGLAAGTYLVTEVVQDGWRQTFPLKAVAGSGELTPIGVLENGSQDEAGQPADGLDLDEPWSVVVSPNGRYVYVANRTSDAINVFGRNRDTGNLTFLERIQDGGQDAQGNSVDRLAGVQSIAITPDGRSLVASSYDESALTVFDIEPDTGQLTFRQSFTDGDAAEAGLLVDGLFRASTVVASADSKTIYVSSIGDDAVAVFWRDPESRNVSFIEAVGNRAGGQSIDSMNWAQSVAVSSDGKSVLVTGAISDALTVFSRDQDTGRLILLETLTNGGSDSAGNLITGLDNAWAVAASHDGRHVYVSGTGADALSVFARDLETGHLTLVETLHHGGTDSAGNTISKLSNVYHILVSPDDRYIYAASSLDSTVVVFRRDDASGRLIRAQEIRQPLGLGIGDVVSLAVSPDGQHIYTAAGNRDRLGIFARDVAARNNGQHTIYVAAGQTVENVNFGNFDLNGIAGWAVAEGQSDPNAPDDGGNAVTVDQQDNVIVVGSAFYTGDSGNNPGDADVVITKRTVTGALLWRYQFAADGDQRAKSVATDQFGNIYVAGIIRGSVDFDPGEGENIVTSAGSFDAFLLKLDADGNLISARNFGQATGIWDLASSIAVDHSGGVYLAGRFGGTIDADPGDSQFLLRARGDADIFLIKLDEQLNFRWAKSFGGDIRSGTGRHEWETATALDVDADGNVFIGGRLAARTDGEAVDLDPDHQFDDDRDRVLPLGTGDAFAAGYGPGGTLILAHVFGGTGGSYETLNSISAGSSVVNVTGTFQGDDFNPGTGERWESDNRSFDIFVSQLDVFDDDVNWAFQLGSYAQDAGNAIVTAEDGSVYLGGNFGATFDVDPSTGGTTRLIAHADRVEGFVAAFDSAGEFRGARPIAGTGADSLQGLALNRAGDLHLTGSFSDTVTIRHGSGTETLTSSGTGTDVFTAKILTEFASVSGHVYEDTNGNGDREDSEPTLPGQTVFIDRNNNGLPDGGDISTLTDSEGRFSFLGMSAGEYAIVQVIPDGRRQTEPSNSTGHSVVVAAGEIRTDVDFGTLIDAVDTTAPSVVVEFETASLSDPINNTVVTFSFSEAVVDFDTLQDVTLIGATLIDARQIDAATYAATLIADNDFDGTASASVRDGSYTDAAGNTGAAGSGSVTVDTRNPEVTVDIVEPSLAADGISTVRFRFTESVVGFDSSTDVTVTGGELTGFEKIDDDSYRAVFTAYAGFEGEGSVTVLAGSYSDAAGNTGDTASDTVRIGTLDSNVMIVVGAHDLIANRADQPVQILVMSSTQERVTGLNMRAQTGDGLGPLTEPHFSGAEFSGGIWDVYSTTTTGGPVNGAEQFFQGSVVFDQDGHDVLPHGLIVTLLVDTTGIESGEFELRLADTGIGSDTSFILAGGTELIPEIVNGLIRVVPTFVTERHVFYNNSFFDGAFIGADTRDDDAIAIDKVALRPGEVATFANYTSYSRGINGVIVDIRGLANPDALNASNFSFRTGNVSDVSTWTMAAEPTVHVRSGAGAEGSDRVTLVWPDGVIAGTWLEVTVKADAVTGLATPDVFYFGNAPGESGNSTTNTFVDGTDFARARDNQRNFLNRAPIDFHEDYNRDSFVDGSDLAIARDHNTNFLTALKLLALTVELAPTQLITSARPSAPVKVPTSEDFQWQYLPEPQFATSFPPTEVRRQTPIVSPVAGSSVTVIASDGSPVDDGDSPASREVSNEVVETLLSGNLLDEVMGLV